MDLEVFLTSEEGRNMCRRSGSLPWLFPIQEDLFPDVIARVCACLWVVMVVFFFLSFSQIKEKKGNEGRGGDRHKVTSLILFYFIHSFAHFFLGFILISPPRFSLSAYPP